MSEPSPESLANQPLPEIGNFGDFIGRERQLLEVNERLQRHRLLTLVGPGGMGKTRLALEIIKRKRGDAAPDAATAFVSLELVTENSEGAVLDALVSGLRLIPGEVRDLRAALAKRLNDTPVLLVLDNCETARSSVASLVRHLLTQCRNLRILATSQHQLGLTGFEAAYELPPLSVPDERPGSLDTLESLESYKLFVTRAQMAAAAWTPEENSLPSLRRLLQLTDGIPLAIEIIAAWAPTMSLAQICEDLENTPFAPVTKRDEYDSVASERHRSMLRCFEWSFRHLSSSSPNGAAGFKRLGVFAGRFTEAAVGKVCEIAAPQKLLANLVKMSLVHPCPRTDPRRYSMLRFTRAFAQEKARTDGIEQNLIARHVDFFFNLASPLNKEGEWGFAPLASPENDWPDLLAAADAAARIGNLPAVWQISGALSRFLQEHGRWTERERLNRAAVDAASRAGARGALERALIDVGIILEAQGRWPESVHQYKLSLVSADKHKRPNPIHQAMALQRLGAVLTRMGDAFGAERAATRLSAITPLLDQPTSKARSLDEEGKMLQGRGELANAEAKYREAMQIRESIGNAKGLAKSQENLGVVLTLQEDWQQAESELQKSFAYWESQGDAQMQGVLLHHLADLYRRWGRLPEALDYCNRSLRFRENTNPKGQAVTLTLLAKIHHAERLTDKAVAALRQSKDLCEALGDVEGETIALRGIGAMHTFQQQWDDALNALNECRQLQESSRRRDVVGLGLTLESIAQVYSQRGDWGQAQVAYADSLRFSREAGRNVQAAGTLMNMAMMQAAQGQKAIALSTFDDAITSLNLERSGKAVLDEALKLRTRLDRKMREGIPWVHWRDAAFKTQQLFIRKQCDHQRKAAKQESSLWKNVASGYEALAEKFIGSAQRMEAALALNEQGSAYRHLSDFRRSENAIRRALSIFEEIALPLGQAASWHKLGDLFAEQLQWPNAEAAYAQSIKLKLECSDDEGEAISQDALAVLLISVGRFVEAERAANRSWEILSESGSPWQKRHPLILLLWIKVEENDPTAAQGIAARLVEAVCGNQELEAEAGELRTMTEAGDWGGVKIHLASAGITGAAETPAPAPTVEAPSRVSATLCSLRRRGQGWEICFKGAGPFQLRNTVGVRYLATLLRSDGEPIHCSRLASSKGRAAVSSSLTAENTPVLTPEAKRAYRVKLAELKEQIAIAESRGQVDEVIDLKEEAKEIDAALKAAHNNLGDDQSLAEDGNRVRNAVCNPIRRVVYALRDDPQTREIGLHLIDQVDLGFNCLYPKNKDKGFRWVVEE